jgi:ankyrin repeat protein
LDIRGARSVTLLGVVLNHGVTITCPLLGEVARYGNEDAERLVLDHLGHLREMNETNALTMAVTSAHDQVGKVSMLLEKGMDIDYVGEMTYDWDFIQAGTERVTLGEFEGTDLHRAAHLGYADAVKFLLEKGARTDLKASGGKYAMERAEMAKHLEVRDI